MRVSRILSVPRAVKGISSKKSDPVFTKGGSIHMYANKENASENFTNDRYYGIRMLKEYWSRLTKDRAARYYVLGTLLLCSVGGAKLYSLQESLQDQQGILGPKKKNYRSRLTVVLDVDETILSFGDKAFRLKGGLVPRPYLAELLDYLCLIDAEVVLWSASTERYLKQVLTTIDPSGHRISQAIPRSQSWFTRDHYYEKNAAWLKRDMNDLLIIENRPLSVRNCNANALLVDDFIRGEYMDTGRDHPPNDKALRTIKEIVEQLEKSGTPVPEYLANAKTRHQEIKDIPCHLAFRQLPDELARGVFYFIGDKYRTLRTADK